MNLYNNAYNLFLLRMTICIVRYNLFLPMNLSNNAYNLFLLPMNLSNNAYNLFLRMIH